MIDMRQHTKPPEVIIELSYEALEETLADSLRQGGIDDDDQATTCQLGIDAVMPLF
jgi:hypothetical protein